LTLVIFTRSHLSETAVDKQFRPGDVAAVVGREKYHGPGDFLGLSEPAEWNRARNQFQALLSDFRRT
jgi:hypothetical protein